MAKNEKELPCKNCITLGACKGQTSHNTIPAVSISLLCDKCSNLQQYLGYTPKGRFLIWWKEVKGTRKYEKVIYFYYAKKSHEIEPNPYDYGF